VKGSFIYMYRINIKEPLFTLYVGVGFQMMSCARSHGVHGVVGFSRVEGYTAHHSLDNSRSTVEASNTKPWKRHNNAKKREKLRRTAGHLDAQ